MCFSMKISETISKSLAKMEAKLSSTGNNNTSQLDPETRSTISSCDLLPYGYNARMEPTALVVAKIVTRTMLMITLIVSLLVLTTVYIQSKSNKCDYGIRSPNAYYEPLTAESGKPGGLRRPMPLSIRMSGRAGVSKKEEKTEIKDSIDPIDYSNRT